MDWDTSDVMREFIKIAEDRDLLGLKQAKYPDNPYQEDLKTIEEKRTKAPDKHIMEQAHPEPAYVAEARGDGGLVENEIENQQKVIEMINKHPTGSLVGRYASAINGLVKMANKCDALGETDAADLITSAVESLLVDLQNKLPLA